MSTRDRIQKAVLSLLEQIAAAIDDQDVTIEARQDMMRLYAGIDHKFQQFNLPTGPDPLTDGGPTSGDLKGTVTHDIG